MIRLETFLQILRPDLITTKPRPRPLVAQASQADAEVGKPSVAGSESKAPLKTRMKVHIPKLIKPTKIPDNVKCDKCDITIKEILVQILSSFGSCF